MARKTGYLANIINLPPLIFRFQFNPELLSEKKAFKYDPANAFGKWGFDQTSAASGFFGTAFALYKDVKEISSLLVATKPLEPVEGEPRSFELEFKLNASMPGPLDGEDHYGGSIEPDLAVLRSFMVPSWDAIDFLKIVFKREVPCFQTPPSCTLNYGGLKVESVMTDLNIKMIEFKEDGVPLRADVTCTLKEQTFSPDPLIGTITRLNEVRKSYSRKDLGADFRANAPIVGAFS